MTRAEKTIVIDSLVQKLQEYPHFYLTDLTGLNAEKTAALRKMCFEKDVKLEVVKNTLLGKALEKVEKNDAELVSVLSGSTAVMFTHSAKVPAVLIKDFRKKNAIPALKAAYAQECVYLGEQSLESLVNIKSREELIGEVIGLLQSPAQNLISALQGAAGQKVAGIVKAIEEKKGA